MKSESLDIVREIKRKGVHTFHEHHHILFDLAKNLGDGALNYVEIGCFEGASACLMMHRPQTNIISIDLGHPRNPQIAKDNVQRFYKFPNEYHYLMGSSSNPEILKLLFPLLKWKGIDLLFIDGGHKYNEVILDYLLYSSLVNKGGYIIFDDMISPTCPDVPKAINFMKVTNVFRDFIVLGNGKNEAGADFKGEIFEYSNEYILQKMK
jgi:predicted O-methyltransferase YrrM